MDAKGIHVSVSNALDRAGLHRNGRSRWFVESPALVWMVQLDRSGAKAWAVMFGAFVRAWNVGESPKSYSNLHVFQEYPLHGVGVPAVAANTRFADHTSFFTMVMDHTHDLVTDEVREEAFDFLANDLASLFARVTDLAGLVRAVQDGQLGGFLDRRLTELSQRPA